MKKVSELIKNIDVVNFTGNSSAQVTSIHLNSREVRPNSLFVAIKGSSDDGSKYIQEAIKNGAKVIVCDSKQREYNPDTTYIQVKNSRIAVAQIATIFYGNPSRKLKLVGVTGTNGKTTTATLLYKLFLSLNKKAALISTIENKIGNKTYKTSHTTPDPIKLNELLSKAVAAKCKYAFMECSSHAIDQHRIHGLHFAGAIFTNLTLDHLDYHKTIQNYAKAKKKLFDMLPKNAFAVVNADDKKWSFMIKDTSAKKYSIGIKNTKASFKIKQIEQSLSGSNIKINDLLMYTKLIGKFNVHNVVGIFVVAKLLGIQEKKIIFAISKLQPPKGRLEFIRSKSGIYGVVDYAHTPDALENALNTLKEIVGKNKILTVVGCGGDRDTSKRPIMANIAQKMSDTVILTSDNPRTEDPKKIVRDMVNGLSKEAKNYICEIDRKKAILQASNLARSGDIILVAGKGHENYQIFKDKTVAFSDMDELKKILKNK